MRHTRQMIRFGCTVLGQPRALRAESVACRPRQQGSRRCALWVVLLGVTVGVTGCLRTVPPGGAPVDASVAAVGWDLATFEASTRATGTARVEFAVSVGDDPGLAPTGPWMAQDEVRTLGQLAGRYLALKARLVSVDGWGSASLGRISVVGSNGRAQWLVAGRPSRILAKPDVLVFRDGALALQRTSRHEESPGLPADDFEDGVLNDALWSNALVHAIASVEQGGVFEARASGGIGAYPGKLALKLGLRGDFELQIDGDATLWPGRRDALANYADVVLETPGHASCGIHRGSTVGGRVVSLRRRELDSAVGTRADPGGLISMRLVRVGSQVTGSIRFDGTDAWADLGKCDMGLDDASFAIWFQPGYADELSDPVELALDNFEVRSAGQIIGYQRGSPEVLFETEDGLLPRVAISPGSFVFVDSATVRLEATAPAKVVYYTLDDTDPTASSTRKPYEAPFSLTTSAQVRAVALTEEGQLGPPASQHYVIGQALARAPLDGDGASVTETVHGWDGFDRGAASRGVAGKVGLASAFDGLRGYLELPDSTRDGSAAYQVQSGAVAIWFKPTRLDGEAVLVAKDSAHFDTGGHLELAIVDGELRFGLQSLRDIHYLTTLAAPLEAHRWHRVAVLFGRPSATILLWDDSGTFVGSWSAPYYDGLGPTLGAVGNQEPFALGAGLAASGDLVATPTGAIFSGALDDFLYLSLE